MSDTPLDFNFASPFDEDNEGEQDERGAYFGNPDSSDSSSVPSDETSLVSQAALDNGFITEADLRRVEHKQVQVTDTQFAVASFEESVEDDDKADLLLIVSAVYQEYTGYKRLPDIRRIQNLTGLSAALIKKTLESQEFVEAATARGIPWDNFSGLTATQMLVAQIITNPVDKRDLRAKLRSAGVTYPQYRAWMSQPAFSQYMNRITEGMLVDHIPDFNTVLTKKALAGDLHTIKYINELSGRHDPSKQQVADLQQVVQNLLTIIQKNVKDPETLQAIANEFSLTMTAAKAGNSPVIQGELG